MENMEKSIWISYDLGVRGDYEGIYTWLDQYYAIECGDSLALLKYKYTDDLTENLKKDIKESVEINKKTRIYIIWRDNETKKMKGRFIFGTRKSPPWSGYAVNETEIEDEEI